MYRPFGLISLVALILACLLFLVAGADISVSDLTATREIGWGLFCVALGLLFWVASVLYVRVP
jgi:hypothetical protein